MPDLEPQTRQLMTLLWVCAEAAMFGALPTGTGYLPGSRMKARSCSASARRCTDTRQMADEFGSTWMGSTSIERSRQVASRIRLMLAPQTGSFTRSWPILSSEERPTSISMARSCQPVGWTP